MDLLDGIEGLCQRASGIKIFATSREEPEIRRSMDNLGADAVAVDSESVKAERALSQLKVRQST